MKVMFLLMTMMMAAGIGMSQAKRLDVKKGSELEELEREQRLLAHKATRSRIKHGDLTKLGSPLGELVAQEQSRQQSFGPSLNTSSPKIYFYFDIIQNSVKVNVETSDDGAGKCQRR